MAWTNKWIGRPWSEDYDCVGFIEDVLLADLGMVYEFPRMNWKRVKVNEVANLAGRYAMKIERPQDYDGVLMSCALGSHVGLYAAPGAVLHCTESLGSVLTPLDRLEQMGLRFAGFYRWT